MWNKISYAKQYQYYIDIVANGKNFSVNQY